MTKPIRNGGTWIQKNAERIPLASFVSKSFGRAKAAAKQMDSREARMGLGLACALMLLIGLNIFFRPFSQHATPDTATPTQTAGEPTIRNPFTGAIQDSPTTDFPYVFAVMVENSYDAWPLSGLEDAFLVIEAPAEGNIPRFISFFTSDMETEKIGPVRSARPYYVDWANGWSAIYQHVGGSPEALELIHTLGVQDVDEFFNGSTFWRSTDRSAPHNAYTSIGLITKHAQEKEFPKAQSGFFTFKDPGAASAEPQKITVQWYDSPSRYDAVWTLTDGVYVRSQGDVAARSSDGDSYKAANMIVMETDIRSIDEKDRKHIRTIGEGAARMYQNGTVTEGTWKKDRTDAPLRFFDAQGKELEMLPGATWVEVVSDLSRVH